MPTQTQPWLRAELIAAPETTPGAQLMIPADGIEFHDDQLVFHHQGDIVYVAPQGQLRSITWFARQPHPETARRKAQWPNHGTRWTDEERAELQRHLRAGHGWKAISNAHGRSRTGCQQEAVKQGWLDPETLTPTPKLLGTEDPGAAEARTSSRGTDTQANELTSTEPSGAPSAALADLSPAVAFADAPADPASAMALAGDSTDAPPDIALVGSTVSAPSFRSADPNPKAHSPRHSSPAAEPDRPQIPHQIPHQRDGATDAPPGPGSRFLSRAQSSLARATLGAYVNPPRAT